MSAGTSHPLEHLQALQHGLETLTAEAERIDRLGRQLARVFRRGHRLLVIGGGSSAMLAAELAAHLVGRYAADRAAISAIALGPAVPAFGAAAEDSAPLEIYTRQVHAHGRPGDVLVVLSCAAAGPNVVAATKAALCMGIRTVGFTGRLPSPLSGLCCDVVAADASDPYTVLEIHQVALHLLCGGIDAELFAGARAGERSGALVQLVGRRPAEPDLATTTPLTVAERI